MTRRWAAVVLAAVALAPGAALAKLPPPGQPPDPAKGETYDGRRRPRESMRRHAALALPRAVLVFPRLVMALARTPVLALIERSEHEDRKTWSHADLTGWGVIIARGSGYLPAAGLRLWTRRLFGPGAGVASIGALTSGTIYVEGKAGLTPNPVLPRSLGGWARALHRGDERYWGLAGDNDPLVDGHDVVRRVAVDAVDVTASGALRPGGGAGGWRFTLSAGGGLRRFGPGKGGISVDPATTPGFEDGATFLRGGLLIERIGTFDASRGLAGLDVSLAAISTVGVADGDRSRYVTTALRAEYGIPVGGGMAVVASGIVGDQPSWGEDPPTFYDRMSPGSYGFLRGFPTGRFRGGAIAAVALDAKIPLAMTIDWFLFLDNGAAFEEHFADFTSVGLRTSMGGGLRMFLGGHVVEVMIGWGVGDGLTFGFSFG